MMMASSSDIAAEEIAKAAKAAFEESQLLPTAVKTDALAKIKQQLEADKAEILAANKRDMEVQLRVVSRFKTHTHAHIPRRRKSRSMQGGSRTP